MNISWSTALAMAFLTFVGIAMARTVLMTINDAVHCRNQKMTCMANSSLEHLLFDDVGTPPR